MEQKSKTFIKREVYKEILNWIEEPEIIAITGPRQAGKTTILGRIAQDLRGKKVVFVNFEDTEQLESFVASPQTFVRLHLEEKKKTYFLFDEFQYVKNGGKILKLLFDQFPQTKFIITGSSSLKIREIASFLVGRIIFFHLYPLSFSEYLSYKNKVLFNLWQKNNQFFWSFLEGKKLSLPKMLFKKQLYTTFEEYIIFGGYPAVVLSPPGKKQMRLKSLIETYIEKDIIKYLQIGNFLEFKNFTKTLSSQTGNFLHYSSLGSDTALSFREVKRFLSVLEQTFVISLLSPYHTNKITELKKSPKVYFLDLGLRNALISDFRNLSFRQDKGAVMENFVFQNLVFRSKTSHLSFWRTKQGAEVDFILQLNNELTPIEVKFQSFQKPSVPRGVISFLQTYTPRRAIILTRDFLKITKIGKTQILFLPLYFL